MKHAFECLDCGHEWRMNPTSRGWKKEMCNKCGGLYWEWLSYDFKPEDVYLNIEWVNGRTYYGSYEFKTKSSSS